MMIAPCKLELGLVNAFAADCRLTFAVRHHDGAGQEPADPLETLNNSSRMLYAQAKTMAIARKDPVLIVVGDDLVLRKGDKRTSVRVIPQIYHTLKSFAHIPMALDVALAAHGESPLDEETLRELRDYRACSRRPRKNWRRPDSTARSASARRQSWPQRPHSLIPSLRSGVARRPSESASPAR